MKKKILLISIAYYILFLLCYVAMFYVAAKLLKTNNLAAAVVRAGALMFVLTPIFIAGFARFSLLKWYVDPIVAAVVPLFFYAGMIVKQQMHTNSWETAFAEVNRALSGTGWVFLIALFAFGLLASLSPARKAGKSISYRLLSKITAK
ncbi:MAG: hypothetical protein IJ388_00370 [Oscillospiraceae bacterium]|nr:hypothetical protein [Oscillospiraceae bacterium]